MARKNRKLIPQTCAVHLPGSLDCSPFCRDRLMTPQDGPGLAFAFADGTTSKFEKAPEVGPESVDEMDEAVADIEERDEQEGDEGAADIGDEGDELDGLSDDPTAGEVEAELSRLGYTSESAASAVEAMRVLGMVRENEGA